MDWPARMEARRFALLGVLVVAAAAALLGFRSSPARAAVCNPPQTYTVDWGNDENDTGSGTAPGPDGKLSLDEALNEAIEDHGPSTIVLPPGTYHRSAPLVVIGDCGLTIQGAGARVTTIDGGGHGLIFNNGTENLTIDGVTITGGHNTTDSAPTSGQGGAIYNAGGSVTLTNVAIVGNSARFGAGVFNDTGASLGISGSTFSGNSADAGTVAGNGGAIENLGNATIRNSTFSGNSVVGLGGGIFTGGGHSTTLEFVTLDHNQATGPGADGGDLGGSGTVNRWSTIFAGGSPNNCGAGASTSPPSSGDQGIDTDSTCGGIPVDPKLGPLQNNGGPTDTEMLLPASPAIDGGEAAQCTSPANLPPGLSLPVPDQRGVTRPQGSSCDIGGYELVQNADLGLTGAAAPNPVTLGQNVTFTFAIASTGPSNDGVQPTLTDTLPASLTFVSGTAGCSAVAQTVTCNPGFVANGSSLPVTIVAQANALGPVSTTASVSSPRPDGNAADDSATASTLVQAVQLGSGNPNTGGNPNTVGQILQQLLLSNSTFRAAGSGGPIAARKRKAPVGTTVSYTLTEAASVTFTVQQPKAGHRSGKKCVSGKPKKRKGKKTPKKCTLFKRKGKSFTRQSQAGANHFKFTGRLSSGKKGKLKPGKYRLVGIATDAAGRRSKALTASFKIVG